MTAYDQIVQEGYEKGKKESIMIFIKKKPKLSDKEVADFFETTISFVAEIRSEIKN